MGTIDSRSYRLTCTNCGADESDEVVQSGSSYRAGSWSDFSFSQFDASIKQTTDGPRVVSATCKKCLAPARVELA